MRVVTKWHHSQRRLKLPDLDDVLRAIERQRTSASKAETFWLDFKTEKHSLKETVQDLAEAAVCFANAGGGVLVVGVLDTGTGPEAFVGTTLVGQVVRSRIHALTQPPLTVSTRELPWAGSGLLVVEVPEGLDVYSTGKGIFTQRWNDACLPMRPADVARLSDERSGIDWSAQPSGRGIDDVDAAAMQSMRGLLRSTADDTRERVARLDDMALLRELNLLSERTGLTDRGHRAITEAGDPLSGPVRAWTLPTSTSGPIGPRPSSARGWSTPASRRESCRPNDWPRPDRAQPGRS